MSSVYGDGLKEQRESAGPTQRQLADTVITTRSHIAHTEAGRQVPWKEDARRLDAALNTGNVLSGFLPEQHAAVADYFESVRLLEQQAVMMREFALSYVPGILQTESYARAVLGLSFPPVSDMERDRRVVTRLERAKVLEDPVTPVVWALLDEAVLHRRIGGPNVIPLLSNMLTLMWFEDQPPLAYGEGLHMGKLHDAPAVVQDVRHRCDFALGNALPLKGSPALPRATAKGWRKSSYSNDQGGSRLEVIDDHSSGVAVRDSKVVDGSAVVFSVTGWMSFIASLRN